MLKIKWLNASVEWKDILNWVDLEVKQWQLHIILWPNGSWKSTLWKIILWHQKFKIKSWTINFDWKDLIPLKTFERAKLWVFLSHQHPVTIDGVSWFEVLRASQKETWEHISLFKFKRQTKDIIKNCHLKEEFLERDFNSWASWWEAKKMEIASMLALESKLAFLDEIDSWLDFDALNVVISWINQYLEDKQRSIILVTHSKHILEYIKPDKVHIFCEWSIIKTWKNELIKEINQKWYAKLISEIKCNDCDKKEECEITKK